MLVSCGLNLVDHVKEKSESSLVIIGEVKHASVHLPEIPEGVISEPRILPSCTDQFVVIIVGMGNLVPHFLKKDILELGRITIQHDFHLNDVSVSVKPAFVEELRTWAI